MRDPYPKHHVLLGFFVLICVIGLAASSIGAIWSYNPEPYLRVAGTFFIALITLVFLAKLSSS